MHRGPPGKPLDDDLPIGTQFSGHNAWPAQVLLGELDHLQARPSDRCQMYCYRRSKERAASDRRPFFQIQFGAHFVRANDPRTKAFDDLNRALDQLLVGGQLPFRQHQVVFQSDAHVSARQHRRRHIGHLVAAQRERRKRPIRRGRCSPSP